MLPDAAATRQPPTPLMDENLAPAQWRFSRVAAGVGILQGMRSSPVQLLRTLYPTAGLARAEGFSRSSSPTKAAIRCLLGFGPAAEADV